MNRLGLYSPMRGQRSLPSPPCVHVMVNSGPAEAGRVLLSPELMSDVEIDEIVFQLKAELDEFAQLAKRELRNLKDEISKK